MSSKGWKTYKFGEILSLPLRNGVNKPTKVRGSGYKMVNMGELFANPIIRNIEMARVPMTDTELNNSLLHPGDLLFARQSLTVEGAGKCSLFLGDDEKYTFEGHLIRARLNDELASSRYIYYYFNSLSGKRQIETLVYVTAAAGIRASDLNNLEIELPPLRTQRRIADILSALDDKIELNRQTNATLEAIAQAIFKEWFVEREQVNNWNELTWGEIATLEYGKSLSGYKDSNAPYVVFGTNGPIGRNSEPLYDLEGIIVGRKGAYRGIHYSPDPFFVIDTAFFLKPKRSFSMKWAYYELLRLDLNNMDSGSAIPSTSRIDFYNVPVFFPPQELMNSFEIFAEPLFAKIYTNEKETRTLASLRDTLLPKLMAGELAGD